MHLAQPCHFAADVFVGRLEDNQIHYGLVFVLPDNREPADCAGARKCADIVTQSRHGTIDDWYLGIPPASPAARHPVLLIPRTWLIRQGYLPWVVLFMPYRSFAIRRAEDLKRHIWLEWPGKSRKEAVDERMEPALKAA